MSDQRFEAAAHCPGQRDHDHRGQRTADRFKELQTYMFQVVPGRSSNSPVVVLAQNKLVASPPMRRLAVPPVTVPKASTSSGNVDGHVEGVTTVVVSVPVVVFPVFHVTRKVLLLDVCAA
jgi:hypothetical protein